MERYENLRKLMKIVWEIGTRMKIKKRTLIKHFIKELMRKIGRPFLEICENIRNPKILKEFYGNLKKLMKI